MQTPRQQRIRTLAQDEAIRRGLPTYLDFLSALLARSVSLTDLLDDVASEMLRTRIREEMRHGFNRPFPETHTSYSDQEFVRFQTDFRASLKKLESFPVVLELSCWSEYPPAKVHSSEIANQIELPWRFRDDVTICTADGSKGLCGTFNDGDCEEAFEIVTWN